MESLGPWECSGSVSRILGHHQDDQKGPECPKIGDLEDLCHLGGDFVIVSLEPCESSGSVSRISGQDDQEGPECPKSCHCNPTY